MNSYNTRQLRLAISEYTERSTQLGLSLFLLDVLIYSTAIAGVIFIDNLFLRVACSIVAGLKISTLFIIAHDAAHASIVRNKSLNKLIARLAFLPSFHNYSLWLIVHNKSHHQSTNIQNGNSWSPLSKDEYDEFPGWRQAIEKFYRSPFGISFYYLVERWWKNKFYPFKSRVNKRKLSHYMDFLLVSTFMALFVCVLIQAGINSIYSSPIGMIMLGLIIPMIVSSFMIGFTVYLQHTHESIPWFRNKKERDWQVDIEEITMYIKFPHWYNLLSHNTMEHTAHHIDSRIPVYHLAKAQDVLVKLLGDKISTVSFSVKKFLSTMKKCKLYDYDKHLWLGFDGLPNCESSTIYTEIEYEHAA